LLKVHISAIAQHGHTEHHNKQKIISSHTHRYVCTKMNFAQVKLIIRLYPWNGWTDLLQTWNTSSLGAAVAFLMHVKVISAYLKMNTTTNTRVWYM